MDNEIYLPELEPARQQRDQLRSSLTIIFKHKVRIAAVFCAIVGTVTVMTMLQPHVYQAKSSVLVKVGREYLNHSDVGNGGPVLSVNQEEMTNSEIQILTNRDLIKKVIGTIGIDNIYPALGKTPSSANRLEAAADNFARALKVEGIRKSNVIQITFQHTTAPMAARAVNTLVDCYTEKHLQVFSDPKSSFLEKQLSLYEGKLQQSENSLQKFKHQNGVFSLEDQRKLLLDQRAGLDIQLKASENAIAEQRKRMAALAGQSKRISDGDGGYTSTERDKIIVEARARLLSLQIEEQEILKKYTETNPLVSNVRKEIALVTRVLKEQEEEIRRKVKSANPIYQNVQIELNKAEAELHSQQAKAETLRPQLRQLDGELQALDFSEKDIQNLKREQSINEKNYQTYVERTEQARIADDMNRLKLANISIIEKAAVPVRPVKPNKRLNVALGMVFGALVSLGVAFASEFAAQGFSTPESVEKRLGLPVLAAIPYREG